MTSREKYLARQRRYNASEKGRARCARYRREHPDRLAETRARDNKCRIFLGAFYAGREGRFPYLREAIEHHLNGMLDDFRAKQAEERAAFREELDAELSAMAEDCSQPVRLDFELRVPLTPSRAAVGAPT